jgi:hypothetical protein
MLSPAYKRRRRPPRVATVLALLAATGLVIWVLVAPSGDSEAGDRPPAVTLGDVVADPQRFDGRTIVVAGRIRDRTEMSYELTRRGRAGVLLVRRREPELRPKARRGDRIEVVGELQASPRPAPDGVVAELLADEVLLYDRADEAPRR